MDVTQTRTCSFCNARTKGYEALSQVPQKVASLEFLKTLRALDGTNLTEQSLICIEHEDDIHLRYLSHLRNYEYCKTFKNISGDKIVGPCARCKKTHSTQSWYKISFISSHQFKEYVLEFSASQGNYSTRKGSGLAEADVLCKNCYVMLSRKYRNWTNGKEYTPTKAQAPSEQPENIP